MLLSGRSYFFCHSAAFDGVPVTMPARRQKRVFCRAGAIWLVERLPSPHNATPNFLPGACALPMLLSIGKAARAAVCVRKRRRWISDISNPRHGGFGRAKESSRTRAARRIVHASTARNRGRSRRYSVLSDWTSTQGNAVTSQFKLLACKGFFASSMVLVLAGCAGDGTGLDSN